MGAGSNNWAKGSLAGKSVSQYRVLEKIGKGGMGEVYLARDTALERNVALKFLDQKTVDDPSARSRILSEARIAAAIDHPFICKVYGVGEYGSQIFIAMEFVEGPTLEQVLESGRLSVRQALAIAKEIAEALARAHEKGILHRDLKPGNLIHTPDGHIKILDFGLAEWTPQLLDDTQTQVQRPPGVRGTLAYMSPEQINGHSVDLRSDIFSFGVMLYEMLAGIHPFRDVSPLKTALAIQSREVRPLTHYNRSCPWELERLLSKMLAKDPGQRYQSSKSLQADLLKMLEKTRLSTDEVEEEQKSLAVLPFLNLSADPENEYFSDGMTEEIITRLSPVAGLRVISRTSVMRYKDTIKDLQTIGRELAVAYVLEGSVRRDKDQLRIVCKLVDVETEEQTWADVYDRKAEHVFAVQTEVTERIASALKASFTAQQRDQLARLTQTRNPQTYHLYLRGRYFLNKLSSHSIEHAITYFRRALDEDPSYAPAYAGLASCYASAGHFDYLTKGEAYPRAKSAAEAALKIDARLCEAHTSYGLVLFHEWEWSRAENSFRQAIEINPNYGDAHVLYSWCLVALARWDEALAEARAALKVDPLSVLAGVNLGWVLLCLTRFDEAIEEFERTIELEPTNLHAKTLTAFCLQGKGLLDEAVQILEKWAWSKPLLGWGYAMCGRTQEARKLLKEVTRPAERQRLSPAQIALIYFFLGEINRGLKWLERAFLEHDTQLVHVRMNAFAAPYFTHPKAEKIFSAMGLEPSIELIYRRMEGHPGVHEILSKISTASVR